MRGKKERSVHFQNKENTQMQPDKLRAEVNTHSIMGHQVDVRPNNKNPEHGHSDLCHYGT
jgi:hypothetical protein